MSKYFRNIFDTVFSIQKEDFKRVRPSKNKDHPIEHIVWTYIRCQTCTAF